jgi:hypothetical protein
MAYIHMPCVLRPSCMGGAAYFMPTHTHSLTQTKRKGKIIASHLFDGETPACGFLSMMLVGKME